MRHDRHDNPSRRSRLVSRRVAAVIVAAAIAVAGVATAIAASGGDSGGVSMGLRAAGTAIIGNSKGTGAIFTASGLKPGASTLGSVTITNQGDPATYTLSKSNLADRAGPNGGTISSLLTLQVVDEANPGTPIYDGSLSGFASGAPISLGSAFAHNEAHTYDFTVTLPHTAGNTEQGAVATVNFNWNATALDTGTTGTTDTGGVTTQQQPAPPTTGGGTSGFVPSGGGVTVPDLVFGGSTTQTTTDSISLFMTCSQACTATFGGTVNVPGASKVYRLSTLSTRLRAGVRTQVTIRFPSKVRSAVRKAISRRKRVTVSLRIGTRSSAGASRTTTRRIVIRHR